jgi:hypothetical protein
MIEEITQRPPNSRPERRYPVHVRVPSRIFIHKGLFYVHGRNAALVAFS